MSREDRRCSAWQRRARSIDERRSEQICRLLRQWERDRAMARARSAREHRVRAARARREVRQQEKQRRERWKQMTRRDITMADMLGKRT